jgi:membrane protein DedA with SNARE-associated domain
MSERARPPSPTRDEVPAAVVGTALWAVALVVLGVFFRHQLQRHDADWWLWTCLIGLLMGLFGTWYALRRRARAR